MSALIGSNEEKTLWLYRRVEGRGKLGVSVPTGLAEAVDYITDPNLTLDQYIDDAATVKMLLFESMSSGSRRRG